MLLKLCLLDQDYQIEILQKPLLWLEINLENKNLYVTLAMLLETENSCQKIIL